MSYEPTERAPQPSDQQLTQPLVTPPSNPSLPPYAVPTEQHSQPPQQSGPSGYVPLAAPPTQNGAKLWVILLVVVLLLLIVGGGGYTLYQSTRPKPVITLTSQYTNETIPVGATSTSFILKGTDFSASSALTFLLDGSPISGTQNVQSDSKGNVTATLTVTDAWTMGTHLLKAQDASGYTTKKGVKVEIVNPGQANTPGPNGAPTDSTNMSVIALVLAGSSSGTVNLIITGSANGGTVCRDIDDGKPHSRTGLMGDVPYIETIVSTCSGTYKGGKLDYIETATSDTLVFANGLTCTARAPYVSAHLQGTFTDGTSMSGMYEEDATTSDCNVGAGGQPTTPNSGTWTGIAVVH